MSNSSQNPFPNPHPSPLAFGPRDAAKALGVSERTLWTWTQNREIPHIRIGRRVLYPVDVLRKWMADGCAGTSQGKGGGDDSL